jgi:hypothetical protein
MLRSKSLRGRGGCDCPDCSVPKKTQRNIEKRQWMQDYKQEKEQEND